MGVMIENRIRKYREKAGLSRLGLADLCKVSSATIGRLERGEGSSNLRVLLKVSEVLGVSLDVLMCNKGEEWEDVDLALRRFKEVR